MTIAVDDCVKESIHRNIVTNPSILLNNYYTIPIQPMPHTHKEVIEGPIEANKPNDELRQEPYTMPAGFEWASLNVDSPEELQELYDLLANNYVEDDDALFRFDYSPAFLKWALTPPGYSLDFLLCVRAVKSRKLVAFISGVPATVRVRDSEKTKMVEINFLCVHKKLRAKRLAPVLIKEITRRVNLVGVFQAVYTAGVVLPVPVAAARYHHRSLNPKKLVSVGFSRLAPRMTLARLAKLYKLPVETSTPGLRPMELKDVTGVHTLLTTYLQKFKLSVVFEPEDIHHWLLPRPGVIDSFVVENSETGEITDFCSYYHLPSTILGRDDTLRAAYSYYNVATSVSWVDLMRDCLVLAKKEGADVFNALNLMDNDEYLKELKFGLGDGNLQYYLYNWACPTMQSNELGIVLL
jgi:glycylpeptide N-tetradecanoyltransferase